MARRIHSLAVAVLLTALTRPGLGQTVPDVVDQTAAVQTALTNRQSVKAAQLKVRSALANQSALAAYPATRAEFGYGTAPDVGIGNDLLLAQPIDLFGKTRSARDSGKAAVLAARAQLLQTELDTQSETLDAFAEALSADQLVKTGQELADLAQRSYDATKKRIDAGDLPPAQLLRADLELQRARQSLALRTHALAAARIRLNSAMGVRADLFLELSQTAQVPPESKIQDRPDISLARSGIASASADAAIAEASRWPDVELQFARSYWDMPEQYEARIQFVVPIFDFGAASQKAASARADRDSARSLLQDRLDSAQKEVAAAKLDYEAAKGASQGFDQLTAGARALLTKEQGAFTAGASTLLDVLEATRSLRETEESAVDARKQLILAEAKYLAATGTLLSKKL